MAAPAVTGVERLTAAARADVQGFVTSAYAHLPHGVYVPLRIARADAGRAWLRALLPQITDASSWRVTPGAPKVKPRVAVNLALTYGGLAALGLSQRTLCTFPVELREGMAEPERARVLGDVEASAPERWDLGGPAGPAIHALLILNAGSDADADELLAAQRELLHGAAGDGVVELEAQLQRGSRPASQREPFGFRDGVGQPQIAGIKGSGVATGEFILGYLDQYGFYPVSPVVAAEEDPHGVLPPSANPSLAGRKDLGRHGSYLVYRKLAQDVAGFWGFLRREAERLLGRAETRDVIWLAAKMVGRWPSGAPLVLTPDRDDPALAEEDRFFYAKADPDGLRCPFGAHVRRANPRDQIRPDDPTSSRNIADAHRILRRATAFGEPLFDPALLTDPDAPAERARALLELADDGAERGVHFFAVNADVGRQFEQIQQAWCNNPRFNALADNKDPIAGDNGRADQPPSRMTIPRDPVRLRTAPLPRFVTVRGGGYFFLPSLTALRYLAQDP